MLLRSVDAKIEVKLITPGILRDGEMDILKHDVEVCSSLERGSLGISNACKLASGPIHHR